MHSRKTTSGLLAMLPMKIVTCVVALMTNIAAGTVISFADDGWILWEGWQNFRTLRVKGTEVEEGWKYRQEFQSPEACEEAMNETFRSERDHFDNASEVFAKVGKEIHQMSYGADLPSGTYSRKWRRFLCVPDNVDPRETKWERSGTMP